MNVRGNITETKYTASNAHKLQTPLLPHLTFIKSPQNCSESKSENTGCTQGISNNDSVKVDLIQFSGVVMDERWIPPVSLYSMTLN